MIILGTNSIKDTGFDVANSCRFNDGSSDYLNLSLGTPSNRKIFTCSAWVKRASTGTYPIFWFGSDSDNWFMVKYESDSLRIESKASGSTIIDVRTNALYRDFSAWYHVLVAVDTSQGTASNRIKIYINGVQETSLQTSTYPNENTDLNVITTAEIGNQHTTQYFDGYMAEVVFVDGTAQANTDLGEFDEDSGIWKPIDVSGLTFGTNGFYLDFEDSAALGDDVSGNGNDFTVNNLTAIDQTTDTPTNNFATWNPSIPYLAGVSFEDGNTQYTNSTNVGSPQSSAPLTFGMTQGKWYAEFECDSRSGDYPHVGIAPTDLTADPMWGIISSGIPMIAYGVDYNAVGNIHRLNSVIDSSVPSYTTGDVIGIALDLDNGRVYFSKNGTYVNSGNPSTASNPYTFTQSDYSWTMGAGAYNNTIWKANLGNPAFTISSGNTDGNDYGNFEYAVPSGYLSLCTKNLSEVLG